MGIDQVIQLGRLTLQEVVLLALPVLAVAVAVSLLVNVMQVVTSLQDNTISTVPRLLACAGACFFLMPWMFRHLSLFTLRLLSDFHVYVR